MYAVIVESLNLSTDETEMEFLGLFDDLIEAFAAADAANDSFSWGSVWDYNTTLPL